ncbi:MAG: type II 3-dehydroquinate dehydratase [Acidimicrobiales bacterium]
MTQGPAAVQVLVAHGPNLDLLGEREPEVYGTTTLAEVDEGLRRLAGELGVGVRCEQRNGEGELVDLLHDARAWAHGVVLNPGAYAHYGYALRDAVAAIGIPCVEVHVSNIHAREEFRHRSVIAPVAAGVICGCGPLGYALGLRAVVARARGE